MSDITVYKGDITALECEAIVNAANHSLLGGGGYTGRLGQACWPSAERWEAAARERPR